VSTSESHCEELWDVESIIIPEKHMEAETDQTEMAWNGARQNASFCVQVV